MTIRDDARQEAERRWPSYPTVGFSGASDRQQAFIDGASWASEQADREPSEAELLHAANVYMGYEPPYKALDEFSPEFLADIRAALLVAQEVRNRG